jgi:hypothetical protein
MSPKKPPAASLTYAQWRERARAKLSGASTMRERRWTQLFIAGKTPDEAAGERQCLDELIAKIEAAFLRLRALPRAQTH